MIIKITANLLLFIGLSTSVCAQFGANTARRVISGTSSPPAACSASPVDIYARTGGTSPGFYICLSTNTWTGPLSGAAAGLSSGNVTFGGTTYSGYSFGANSFPPRINGISAAGMGCTTKATIMAVALSIFQMEFLELPITAGMVSVPLV